MQEGNLGDTWLFGAIIALLEHDARLIKEMFIKSDITGGQFFIKLCI
jgi:hypothetical protein